MNHYLPLLLLTLLTLTGCRYMGQKEAATKQAKAWAKEMGMPDAKISCAGQDSDGDGYVSCTVKNGDDQPIQSIECGGAWTLASGCKGSVAKVKVR